MTRRRPGLCLGLCASLGAAAVAAAGANDARTTTIAIEVRLAPDHGRRGPPAWTWVRGSILPRLRPWPDGLDPFAALRIRLELPSGLVVARDVGTPDDGSYLRAEVRSGERVLVTATMQRDGRELWRVDPSARYPDRWLELASLLACRADAGPVGVDVAAVTGNLMAAAAERDLESELLTIGAGECGVVRFAAWRDERGLEVRGYGDGGLTLPAVLLFLADRQRHSRDAASSLEPRRPEELERWLILAASAELDDREEAARQLSRFDDPRARRSLERLLFADGRVRSVAMASLARAGHAQSVERVIAAVELEPTDHADGAAVATATISTLWPALADRERRRVRDRLAGHSHEELRALADRLSPGARPTGVDDRSGATARRVLVWVALASLLALAAAYATLARRS